MYRSPKYWKEMKEIRKKFLREQADKQASERASRRAGGPASHAPDSDQASEEDASKQR